MGHDQAIRGALRPEPNKWDASHATGFHRKAKQLFMDRIHREVHRPVWESQFFPTAEVGFLKMLANRNRQQLPNGVIGLPNQGMTEDSTMVRAQVIQIALSAKVVDNLGRVKR